MISIDEPVLQTSLRQVRQDQARTGLILALRTFTSAEVLSDDNAFHCKRCWRRLNPVRGTERDRMRRRRMHRGKGASGSEDSDEDIQYDVREDESDLTTSDTADSHGERAAKTTNVVRPIKRLVAPKPKQALDSAV